MEIGVEASRSGEVVEEHSSALVLFLLLLVGVRFLSSRCSWVLLRRVKRLVSQSISQSGSMSSGYTRIEEKKKGKFKRVVSVANRVTREDVIGRFDRRNI